MDYRNHILYTPLEMANRLCESEVQVDDYLHPDANYPFWDGHQYKWFPSCVRYRNCNWCGNSNIWIRYTPIKIWIHLKKIKEILLRWAISRLLDEKFTNPGVCIGNSLVCRALLSMHSLVLHVDSIRFDWAAISLKFKNYLLILLGKRFGVTILHPWDYLWCLNTAWDCLWITFGHPIIDRPYGYRYSRVTINHENNQGWEKHTWNFRRQLYSTFRPSTAFPFYSASLVKLHYS